MYLLLEFKKWNIWSVCVREREREREHEQRSEFFIELK